MHMRKFLLGFFGLLFCIASNAQTTAVTGKVTDEAGKPLEGISVVEKKSVKGTVTDASGVFKLTVKTGSVLVFSGVGFGKKEVAVTGTDALNVTLSALSNELSEVVVTALGIKREKKALGYAVSTVEKKDLELRPEGDIGRVLSGKAPGLNILNSSGLSGSGTNIVIRGVSSISGTANPLFIVDGVPFNGNTNAQSNFTYGNQTSSRFLDLDPNNIESVNVLKGLSATTLYGEQGRNGVILITTKNGSTQKTRSKNEVSVSQSYFSNTVANLPEYEQTWGAGFDQSLGLAFFSNWGARIEDPPVELVHPYDRPALNAAFPEYIGAKYPYKYYNSVEDFFRVGSIKNTSVNVAGTSGPVNFNLSYSYLDDEGFTPGNGLIRNNFGAGGTAKLTNKITVTGTMNYVITNVKSPPTSTGFGSNPSNPSVFGNLLYTPVTVDLMGLPYQNPIDGSSVYYRPGNDIQHPLWTVNNSFTENNVNRLFGTMQFKYDIMKGLSFSYRLGLDQYTEEQLYAQNKGGVFFNQGIMRSSSGTNTIWDHTFFLHYDTELSKDWTLTVDGGVNSRENIYEQAGLTSTQQLVFGLLDHSNFITHDTRSEDGSDLDYTIREQTVSAFAQAIVGYKEYLFFNIGARNGWTSTLEEENRSLFYPGGSVSFIPTSAFESLRSKNVNYLKLRLGYSTSARFPDPYNTQPTLNISTRSFVTRSTTAINTNSLSQLLPNPDLKPELQTEFEAGVEGKFIDNRLSIDLTLYNRLAKDQILRRDLDPATGSTVTYINAGSLRNKGIEMALGYTVIRNQNWRWQLDGLYTLNQSLVTGIPSDVKQIIVAGYSNLGNVAINDQPFGVIQGNYIQRDAKTNEYIVSSSGDYLVSSDTKIIGDPNPQYKLTGISTLSYKGFSFRMQWDYTQGGDMYSSTSVNLVGRGVTKETDFDRFLPFVLPGVKQDGTPNDVQVSATSAFFNNLVGSTNDLGIYEATVVRLREASLSYNLPEKMLSKSPFGSVSLTISGTNLFYYAPNFPEYVNFDPETSGFGVSSGRGLEFFTGPSSRRIGASLRVTF